MFAFRNLRIGVKLSLLIIITSIGFAAFSAFAFSTLGTVRVNGPLYRELALNQELIADILPPPSYVIETHLFASLLLDEAEHGDSEAIDALLERAAATQKDFDERHAYWVDVLASSENQEIAQTMLVEAYLPVETYFQIFNDQYVPALRSGQAEKVDSIFHDQLIPAYEEHRAAVDKIVELQNAAIKENEARAQTLVDRSTFLMVFLAILTVVLAIGLGTFISRSITLPVRQLTDVASQITSGNLAIQAESNTKDEVGVLAGTFNAMTNRLREILGSLEQRVAERTEALTTVAEVSTAVSTILETDKLLQKVVDLSKERFGFYHAHIYLLDETGTSLVLSSGAGDVGKQMVAKGHAIPLDREQSLVARAAREKKGVTVNDVTQAPDFLPNPLLPDTHSELAVPMMVGDQVIGVFDVQSEMVGRFTDSDIAVQTTLASQVASAVQNTRQYFESLRFKLGIENSGDAVFATDINGTITYANPAFEKVYGYALAEVIGKNPRIIKSGLLTQENYQGFWNALLAKQSVTGEIVNRHKDGHLVYVAGTNSAIVNDAGEIIGFLAVHHDITEQKKSQDIIAKRAQQQEALNLITQKIQSADTVETALQVAARELGRALGQKPTLVALEPSVLAGENKMVVNE